MACACGEAIGGSDCRWRKRNACKRIVRRAGIAHRAVNLWAGVRVAAALHVQNVNAYHSRLKQLLRRFNGVASR